MPAAIDITGEVYGRYTVISTLPGGKALCRCECGTEREVYKYNLRSGHSKSCGCYQREGQSERATKHGLTKNFSSEIQTHNAMLSRCYNENVEQYKDYGGRGITVCKRWRDSFKHFFDDMGPRPSPEHSLDRIDVNKNYTLTNCRWATALEQAQNKRTTVMNPSLVRAVRKLRSEGLRYKTIAAQLNYSGSIKSLSDAAIGKTWSNVE